MRASRLLSLLLLLQTRGRMTAEQLAGELEVSVRTIYRDVDALSAAGVPVYGDAGHDGGYQLLGGYRTRLTGLTGAEAETLFLSGLPGPAAELGLGNALAAATLKLRAALPASLRESADRLSERFYLDAPGWYRTSDDTRFLPMVASAVWERQVILMRYRRWKEPTEVTRTIEPHGLVLKAGTWYLVARCPAGGLGGPSPRPAAAFRTYRVDQIIHAHASGESFTPASDFELETYWHGYLAGFHERLHTGHALIAISPAGTQRMRGLLPAAVVTAVLNAGTVLPGGWLQATVPIESSSQALADFLRLGADLEVLGPGELRAEAARACAAMAEMYGAGDPGSP
jgi:predicted DNA-binding transcriptional regulator YafY